jgi:CRP-like cAMP-binding protein
MPYSCRPDLERFLNRLTSRSVLSQEEQQAVLNLPCHAAQAPNNVDLVRLDERVDHASLIVAGVVGRFGQNSDGKRQITTMHIPGDMADLHSVVLPLATSALQALSPTTIVRIPHVAIRAAAATYPALAEALWRDCIVDSAILAQWVVNVGRRDARARVAHLLCEMGVRIAGAAAGAREVVFDLPITQTHLADATGMTAVHVNRTLQALRGDGLVKWSAGSVVRIPEWDALAAVGEFDPAYLATNLRPEQRLRIVQTG